MSWFIPAVTALLLWGSGQVFIKRGLQDISPFVSNLIAAVFILLIEVPFVLKGGINRSFFPFIFLFGFFAQLSNFIYPYVVNKTNVSLAGTVLAMYPIVTVILSIVFLKESINPIQIVGIAAILAGTFFLAKSKKENFQLAGWVFWALIGAALVGFGDFVGKVAITKFDLYTFIFAFALSGLPGLLVFRFFDRSPIKVSGDKKDLLFSSIGGLIMPLGLLFYT